MADQQKVPPVQVVTNQVVAAGPSTVVCARDWSTGILGCVSDPKSCVCGWFCTLCFACQLASRLDENCCVPICAGGVIPLRLKTRMLFGIHGDICNDCLMTMCCGPCVLCQMSRELDHVGWHS